MADPLDKPELIANARRVSMLREDALEALYDLAASAHGPVIEIGPYIGGSTMALAGAARYGIVTVEIGGSNPDHPSLASEDIISDLQANLKRVRLLDRVDIIEGHFRSLASLEAVRRAIGGRRAAGLFIDVHPGTEIALGMYAPLLDDNAFVVVDDYVSDIAVDKASSVKRYIDSLVNMAFLKESGVRGWGTWFGCINGRTSGASLKNVLGTVPCVPDSGQCWQMFVGHAGLADDETGNASSLVLFENGKPLGPAHCLHDDIRTKGEGRYSHWRGYLWFSTSDNSDPRDNGRAYEIQLGDVRLDLRVPLPIPG